MCQNTWTWYKDQNCHVKKNEDCSDISAAVTECNWSVFVGKYTCVYITNQSFWSTVSFSWMYFEFTRKVSLRFHYIGMFVAFKNVVGGKVERVSLFLLMSIPNYYLNKALMLDFHTPIRKSNVRGRCLLVFLKRRIQQVKAVAYFVKLLHLRCLTRFWILLGFTEQFFL